MKLIFHRSFFMFLCEDDMLISCTASNLKGSAVPHMYPNFLSKCICGILCTQF